MRRIDDAGRNWLAWFSHSQLWTHWFAPSLLFGWYAVALQLALRRHATFQTHIFDLGYYTQVLWHTAHGEWFFNTLKAPSYLQDHFSPLLAGLAPIFWVIPDARVLLVMQMALLAAPIVPAYAILRTRHRRLAPVLVAAYCFNLLLHRTATHEFHEIMLAAPLLALAFWGLFRGQHWLVALSLGLTLLVREDMGVYVGAFGLYLCCAWSAWRRLGLALIGAGIAWTVLVPTALMPALGLGVSPHLLRLTAGAHSTSATSVPFLVIQSAAGLWTWPKLRAVAEMLLPLGGLPLLGAGEQLLWGLPTIILLALPLSEVGALRDWYVAPLLPMLWCGLAFCLVRLSEKRAGLWLAGLLLGTAITFLAWSPFPGGGDYRPEAYRYTPHHAIGHEVLSRIPPDVPVAVQSALGPHLAGRDWLSVFPWYAADDQPPVIVVDEFSGSPYPLSSHELSLAVKNLKLNPALVLEWEQDGYHVFGSASDSTMAAQPLLVWSDQLALNKLEVAQTDTELAFQPNPASLIPGRTLRVALYWTALSALRANYSISVRLTAPDGYILAQDDAWPGQGLLGTLGLAEGHAARDYHYIPLPEALPADVVLRVIVYDSETQTRLAPEEGHVLLALPGLAQAP